MAPSQSTTNHSKFQASNTFNSCPHTHTKNMYKTAYPWSAFVKLGRTQPSYETEKQSLCRIVRTEYQKLCKRSVVANFQYKVDIIQYLDILMLASISQTC